MWVQTPTEIPLDRASACNATNDHRNRTHVVILAQADRQLSEIEESQVDVLFIAIDGSLLFEKKFILFMKQLRTF